VPELIVSTVLLCRGSHRSKDHDSQGILKGQNCPISSKGSTGPIVPLGNPKCHKKGRKQLQATQKECTDCISYHRFIPLQICNINYTESCNSGISNREQSHNSQSSCNHYTKSRKQNRLTYRVRHCLTRALTIHTARKSIHRTTKA